MMESQLKHFIKKLKKDKYSKNADNSFGARFADIITLGGIKAGGGGLFNPTSEQIQERRATAGQFGQRFADITTLGAASSKSEPIKRFAGLTGVGLLSPDVRAATWRGVQNVGGVMGNVLTNKPIGAPWGTTTALLGVAPRAAGQPLTTNIPTDRPSGWSNVANVFKAIATNQPLDINLPGKTITMTPTRSAVGLPIFGTMAAKPIAIKQLGIAAGSPEAPIITPTVFPRTGLYVSGTGKGYSTATGTIGTPEKTVYTPENWTKYLTGVKEAERLNKQIQATPRMVQGYGPLYPGETIITKEGKKIPY